MQAPVARPPADQTPPPRMNSGGGWGVDRGMHPQSQRCGPAVADPRKALPSAQKTAQLVGGPPLSQHPRQEQRRILAALPQLRYAEYEKDQQRSTAHQHANDAADLILGFKIGVEEPTDRPRRLRRPPPARYAKHAYADRQP
ncbi:hypothetical protein GCM10023170_017190 [Phytohabitans houttuyneae]